MVNLINKRIIIISKLKALGINDNKLFSNIFNGSPNYLKSVYNKHIRCKNIKLKSEIKALLNFKRFRKVHYTCEKCNTLHYFDSKIYDNHYKFSKNHFGKLDQQELLKNNLDYWLKRYYSNNKDNKEFQGIIEYIDYWLSKDILKQMHHDLRLFVLENYKTNIITEYNTKINEMNIKIQRNVKELREIIDHFDYVSFFNDDLMQNDKIEYLDSKRKRVITGYKKTKTLKDRLYIRKTHDLQGYFMDFTDRLNDLINSNKELKDIIDKLDITQGKINNKVLHNKILTLIQDYENSLYEMNFGIHYYSKKTKDGYQKVGAIPFEDSGKFSHRNEKYNDLNGNILFCYEKGKSYKGIDGKTYKSGYKARINYINSNPNLELLTYGKFNNRSKAKHYITYRMRNNPDLLKHIDNLKYKAYMHLLNEKNDNTEKIRIKRLIKSKMHLNGTRKLDFNIDFTISENKIKDYYKCVNFSFDYNNKYEKLRKYNKYIKQLGFRYYFKDYKVFYPTYENDKYLYCSFSHLMNPPAKLVLDIGQKPIWKKTNKLGNLRREYVVKKHVDKNLDFLIWVLSGKENLRKIVHLKGKKHIREKLIELFNYAIKQDGLNLCLKEYTLSLMKQLRNKIDLRIHYINDLSQKELSLKEKYYKLDNKRTNESKHIKQQFEWTEKRIMKQINMINIMKSQQEHLFSFFTHVFNRIEIIDLSKIIYNVFVSQIKLYYTKTLVRYVSTKRSMIELLKLGINNMDYDLSYEFKEKISTRDISVNYNDKFDELLDYKDNTEAICKVSDQTCIPIKSFFNALIKMNFVSQDNWLVNEMKYYIFKITRYFHDLETNILK